MKASPHHLVERAMEVELTDHLGYEPHLEPPGGTGNARNGSTPKTLITEQGSVRIDAPPDRAGTFEPQIVRKRQRRFEGFDEKILALYARGLSTRDIEAHLGEIYGVKSRDRKRSAAMDTDPRLDKGNARIQDPLWRPPTRLKTKTAYTEKRMPSARRTQATSRRT